VLLDLRLEGGTGLDLLDRVRAADGLATRIDPDLPVIVLTGRAAEADRVRSFERGADDHVCKPFLYAELIARIRAVLRRAEGRRNQGVLRVRDLTIDPSTRIVRLGGRRIELSAKEFALLHALAVEPGRVYRKQELLRDVWGYLSVGRTRTLDAHACRLRKKLGPSRRPWVLNVRGVGYKLTEAP
jgi:DNA-binding response OmpR family regulator